MHSLLISLWNSVIDWVCNKSEHGGWKVRSRKFAYCDFVPFDISYLDTVYRHKCPLLLAACTEISNRSEWNRYDQVLSSNKVDRYDNLFDKKLRNKIGPIYCLLCGFFFRKTDQIRAEDALAISLPIMCSVILWSSRVRVSARAHLILLLMLVPPTKILFWVGT